MKTLVMATALGLAGVLCTSPVSAQPDDAEEIKADWYNVIFLKFKPGKRGRAEEIQEKYYAPAGEAANLPKSIMLHMNTGEWDMIRIGPMEYGPASIGWANSAAGRRWRAEFERIAGGREQANAIDEEFASLLAVRRRDVAHVDTD